MYRRYFKPLFDWCTALLVLVAISPVFIIISLIVRLSGSGKIFFIHQRPGLNEKPFNLMKFKTMNDKFGPDGNLLPNVERITRVGNILRKFSLDELPQLINVLRGDISLVGPRPLEMRYLGLYTGEQKRRHHVKPGITGWAQVNGRNAISWEEKFRLDTWYVDNICFSLDVKILLMTLFKVVKREGINSDVSNTVVPFDRYLRSKNNNIS